MLNGEPQITLKESEIFPNSWSNPLDSLHLFKPFKINKTNDILVENIRMYEYEGM